VGWKSYPSVEIEWRDPDSRIETLVVEPERDEGLVEQLRI